MGKDKPLKALCRYCFKKLFLETIKGTRCPRCGGPLRTSSSLTTDYLWTREVSENLRRDRFPKDPNNYHNHTQKNNIKIKDIPTAPTRYKQGAPLNLKKRAPYFDPRKWEQWKTLDIHQTHNKRYKKTRITSTPGELPGPTRRRRRGPSPHPCPWDSEPGGKLSKHYSGWKRCSYRGHYYPKPRNKRGLKYCTGYYTTPTDKIMPLRDCNTTFKIPGKRRFNCQAVETWRREHEKPLMVREHPPGVSKLDRWLRGAFGEKIILAGEPPRYRAEYLKKEVKAFEEFRKYCKKEIQLIEDYENGLKVFPRVREIKTPQGVGVALNGSF